MEIKNVKDYEGIDLIWLGIDQNEMIAAFFTAGCTSIPSVALNSKMIDFKSLGDIIDSLTTVSEYKLMIMYPKMDDFIETVKKGIFIYDWTDVHKNINEHTQSYEILAIPQSPIILKDIKNDALRRYLSNIRLKDTDFTQHKLIQIESTL